MLMHRNEWDTVAFHPSHVWPYPFAEFVGFFALFMQVCTGSFGLPKRTEEENEWGRKLATILHLP